MNKKYIVGGLGILLILVVFGFLYMNQIGWNKISDHKENNKILCKNDPSDGNIFWKCLEINLNKYENITGQDILLYSEDEKTHLSNFLNKFNEFQQLQQPSIFSSGQNIKYERIQKQFDAYKELEYQKEVQEFKDYILLIKGKNLPVCDGFEKIKKSNNKIINISDNIDEKLCTYKEVIGTTPGVGDEGNNPFFSYHKGHVVECGTSIGLEDMKCTRFSLNGINNDTYEDTLSELSNEFGIPRYDMQALVIGCKDLDENYYNKTGLDQSFSEGLLTSSTRGLFYNITDNYLYCDSNCGDIFETALSGDQNQGSRTDGKNYAVEGYREGSNSMFYNINGQVYDGGESGIYNMLDTEYNSGGKITQADSYWMVSGITDDMITFTRVHNYTTLEGDENGNNNAKFTIQTCKLPMPKTKR